MNKSGRYILMDQVVLFPSSMVWQSSIAVLNISKLTELKKKHDLVLNEVNIMLLYVSLQHGSTKHMYHHWFQ